MEQQRENKLFKAGEKLRELRSTTGQSVRKVARQLHISGTYLSEIERGLKEPSDVVLESLATYYKLEKSELFKWYGRIASEEQNALLNNPCFHTTIVQIERDGNLTHDERTQIYIDFAKMYETLKDKRGGK